MTITEKNKLIEDFMGEKISYNILPENWRKIMNQNHPITEIPYHLSWDWLMQVVEKIESLGNIVIIQTNPIKGMGLCRILNKEIEFVKDGHSKIEAVYEAVIQFIQWYNQQPK